MEQIDNSEYLYCLYAAARKQLPDAEKYASMLGKLESLCAFRHNGRTFHVMQDSERAIHDSIAAVIRDGRGMGRHTLVEKSRSLGLLATCGGEDALRMFALKAGNEGNYAILGLAWDEMVKRAISIHTQNLPEIIRQLHESDPNECISRIRQSIASLEDGRNELLGVSRPIKELDEQYDDHLKSAQTPVPTGWATLNNMLYGGGLNQTDFMVITGREGLGKTTMLLNLLLGLGYREDVPTPRTILYEYEMPSFQIAAKALAVCSGVPTWKLEATQRATLDQDELERLDAAKGAVRMAMRCVDDADGEIDHLLARMKEDLKQGYDVFAIDILQELYAEKEFSPSHTIETICKKLRAFARLNRVTVILLAHLRKSKKEDQDAAPTLADLKGGGIAGNATLVLALHSPTYNLPRERRPVEDVEIHIVKNRMGKRGVVRMQWLPATGVYREWMPEARP